MRILLAVLSVFALAIGSKPIPKDIRDLTPNSLTKAASGFREAHGEENAVKWLEQALEYRPDLHDDLVALLAEFAVPWHPDAQKFAEMMKKVAIEQSDRKLEAYSSSLFGIIAVEAGDLDAAVEHFASARTRHSSKVAYSLNLAQALMDSEKVDEAYEVVEDVTILDDEEPQGWLMKGVLDQLKGNRDKALEAYKTVLWLDPNNPHARHNLKKMGISKDKNDMAIAQYASRENRGDMMRFLLGRLSREEVQKSSSTSGHVYFFGLYLGGHVKLFLNSLDSYSLQFKVTKVHGLDSFLSVKDTDRPPTLPKVRPGSSPFLKFSGIIGGKHSWYNTPGDAVAAYVNDTRFQVIEGKYEETLTVATASDYNFRSAFFINIDFPGYDYTFQALKYSVKRKLLVPDTFVSYSQFHRCKDCEEAEGKGQWKAHIHIAKKFNIHFEVVSCSSLTALLRVKSVGGKPNEEAHHGLDQCPEDAGMSMLPLVDMYEAAQMAKLQEKLEEKQASHDEGKDEL